MHPGQYSISIQTQRKSLNNLLLPQFCHGNIAAIKKSKEKSSNCFKFLLWSFSQTLLLLFRLTCPTSAKFSLQRQVTSCLSCWQRRCSRADDLFTGPCSNIDLLARISVRGSNHIRTWPSLCH